MGDIIVRLMRRWRQALTTLGLFLFLYSLLLTFNLLPGGGGGSSRYFKVSGSHNRPSHDVLSSLRLTEEQCDATFPGLTEDIDRTVARGPFTLKRPSETMGPLQARIKDGQLYIVSWEPNGTLMPELLESRIASLHQIHRALLTSPSPLPDTLFNLNIQDQPFGTTWSYARPAYAAPTSNMAPITRAFLMPHFSFWGWPLPFVGAFPRVVAAVDAVEASLAFRDKDPRPVWRGTARFNNQHNPHLRQKLLEATRGAAWADVQALTWDEQPAQADPDGYHSANNSLMIEDFCRYKYVLHTEGITYSGRFQLLQMCGSVLLTPPIAWLQHTTHLVRPLFSCDLDSGGKRWTPLRDVEKGWPTRHKPEDANIVFVSPDWSDLESTVRWLEEHPDVAEGIARRQRGLFVDGGYFSPAAEACYWRALVRGWAKVVRFEGGDWEEKEGIRWELFSMGHDISE